MAKAKQKELTIEEKLEQILVSDDEQPYEVPNNWVWVYFSSVCTIENGYAFKSNDYEGSGIPLIRISNIYDGGIDISKCVYIQDKKIDERFVVSKGDLLIAMSGATTGKNGVYQLCTPAYLNQRVGNIKIRYQNVVYNKFRDYYIYDKNQEILDKAYGGAQPNISSKKIGEMLFPLPPFDEQQRIVERIESLFEKLDQAKELAQNALDTFETHKAAILHKAFNGELTAKWRDENGVNFDSWIEKKLCDVCKSIFDGDHMPPPQSETGVPFLVISNVNSGHLSFENTRFVSWDYYNRLSNTRKPEIGDVLYTLVGSYGIPVLVDDSREFCFQRHMALLKPKSVEPKFLWYLLQTGNMFKEATEIATGTAQLTVPIKGLRQICFDLPSNQEQQEIVSILDSIFEKEERAKELCDVIEKIDLMKKAILARAFRGELGTNDPNEENAVELLKECLH